MTTISRPRIQIIYEDALAAGEDIKSTVIPDGEKWQISRITFGDMSKNDSKSGSFKVDFGVDGDRDILAIAYISGSTIAFDIKRVFVGDGTKVLRVIRENQSNPAKNMLAFLEGFKRIGDI